MQSFPVIDADGHVTESDESLRKYLREENRHRPLRVRDAWDRSFGGKLGKRNVIERVGADKLLFSSDYPHWDTSWPNSVRIFMERDDVSEDHKQQIFGENPQRFYGFKAELPRG